MMGVNLTSRDRRALQIAATAGALFVLLQFAVLPGWDSLQAVRAELPVKVETLAKYRRAVDSAGAQSLDAQRLGERLQQAESGLLQAATPPLAAAALEEWLKQTALAQSIEIRSSEFLKAQPGEEGYTQVPVGLQFQCRVEQLANFLSALESSGKVLSVDRLTVQGAGGNQKMLTVAMRVGGWMKSPPAAAVAAP